MNDLYTQTRTMLVKHTQCKQTILALIVTIDDRLTNKQTNRITEKHEKHCAHHFIYFFFSLAVFFFQIHFAFKSTHNLHRKFIKMIENVMHL